MPRALALHTRPHPHPRPRTGTHARACQHARLHARAHTPPVTADRLKQCAGTAARSSPIVNLGASRGGGAGRPSACRRGGGSVAGAASHEQSASPPGMARDVVRGALRRMSSARCGWAHTRTTQDTRYPYNHTRKRKHTHSQKQTHTNTHKHTHTQTQTQTHIYKHTNTHTNKQTHTHTHTRTHTHTHCARLKDRTAGHTCHACPHRL